ncbi:MAG TPA: acylphosphatase [Capsulimonadaceae bacterium]|jgi:acylphosphatase
MTKKRVQAVVSGRVQGVGYRYFAQHVAEGLGIVGTIRNIQDGQVETIAEGDEESLAHFLAELRKGPLRAEVTNLSTAWDEAEGDFSRFEAVA